VTVVARQPTAGITTGPKTLEHMYARLEKCWAGNRHVPEETRSQINIAVGEIVANIVEHAAKNGPVLVQMSVEVHPDEVHVIFTDDGAPCPTYPETVNMPDELAERGRGIPMMQSVLRKLTYHRSATQNHWRLISRYFGR